MVNKLILGTANFGMNYGIAFGKQVSKEEVFRILDLAVEEKVFGVDTAPVYGDAEEVIGEYFSQKGQVLKVITKLPKKYYKSYEDVKSTLLESLKNLKIDSVDYLLVHSFETFKQHKELLDYSLKSLKEQGLLKFYGISVYHPWEVFQFLETFGGNFAVEFPINVFDRRFVPYIEKWKEKGIILFARSVFLQGLFFLPEEKLKGVFERVKEKILRLREISEKLGISLACLCLLFVLNFSQVDGFIVGVDDKKQLEDLLNCAKLKKIDALELEDLEIDDEDIILPYKWRKQ
ncbi:aldo/keto reductase [Pampinifervens florentissimum]|uniref:aldo/keto reductase n=1 Tax=Pampinifervens florentissimum TaxID=1632019 RepID=UPI0013B4834E|nr:aldo/keto reductase [Hydrogenobacter sp. T-8]QID32930.1 aldo/keto reductase [Hydrogenobacter sp. T-8]